MKIFSRRMLMLFFFLALAAWMPGCAMPQSFRSSPDAVNALVSAMRTGDHAQAMKILGSEGDDLLSSGDDVADSNRIAKFLEEYDEKHQLLINDDGTVTLTVGESDWPMPIPIVKSPWFDCWHFDVAAGKEEMINRRIGRNELDAIQTCLATVDAQRDYAKMDPERVGKPVYAQKFLSEEGKKNGLYWPTKAGEAESPLGPLVTAAAAEGYTGKSGHPTPYHGYYYRILAMQGAYATGGPMNYLENGNLTKGFAVIAYPADYGNSGIMTYIVNQTGIVYACDLGKETGKTAAAMTTYDPAPEWWPVPDTNTVLMGQ